MRIRELSVRIFGLVPLLGERIAAIYHLPDNSLAFDPTKAPHPLQRLREEFGSIIAFSLLFIFPSVLEVMDRVERDVLASEGTEPAKELKRSFSSDCSMFAVAGAIVAQVAITALALDGLSSANWTARGAFITSLVTGLLSVYFACRMSAILSSMYRHAEVKEWLSEPYSRVERRRFEKKISDRLKNVDAVSATERSQLEDEVTEFLNRNMLKTASIHACFMLQAPSSLLNLSVGSFLVGLGIYLGYVFTKNLDPTSGVYASRAVLICYIVCVACCLGTFSAPRHFKTMEHAPVRRWVRVISRASMKAKTTQSARDEEAQGDVEPPRIEPTVATEAWPPSQSQKPQLQDISCRQQASSCEDTYITTLEAAIRAQEESAKALRLILDELRRRSFGTSTLLGPNKKKPRIC